MASRAALAGPLARFAGGMRIADALMVGVLIAVVALMIVPLPPVAMDMLIALNMVMGLMLLISALYVVKPLDFSSFPTVLLLSTLFRLSISIATTRMILTEADAGAIVRQFGEMVAGGNLIVGLVVFLIITIVQFLVISKGAERVAEVAARFNLDAMPGKQLSIDSDLRSGLISKDEARSKRHMLEQESKFHGSLDGAMKFIKGDAIASIIIVLVNLIGGLSVGALYHGMPMGEAVETYSILTIGDGLVAQLPALFTAMAAGFLVTRTTDEVHERDLGPVIARQIGGKPHVLFIAAGLATLIGLLPGFPTLVFSGLSLLLLAGGLWQHPVAGLAIRRRLGLDADPVQTDGGEVVAERPALEAPDALRLELAIDAAGPVFAEASAAIVAACDGTQREMGVPVPPLRIVRVARAPGLPIRWRLLSHGAQLAGGTLPDAADATAIATAIDAGLRRHLGDLLGLQEVTDLLNWLGDAQPEVVKEAVRQVPTTVIADVLRMLVEEGVPLTNLRDLVQAIAVAGQANREASAILEQVRAANRRSIVARIAADGRLRALLIDSAAEEAIRSTLTDYEGEARLALSPEQMRAIVRLLVDQCREAGAAAILTARDLRRPMRLLVAADLPDVPLLSFNELDPHMPLDVVGQLRWNPEAEAGDMLEAAE